MTKWLICVVSLLAYLAFPIVPCDSQTITVNPSGTWTEGSSVTLTCTISSYSGEMKWKLGSTDVAKCTPQTCSVISTGEGAFLFGFDTTNHIFTWTIKPVKSSNNGNMFYCFDGTNTANYTATVQNITAATTPRPEDDQTAITLSSVALPIAALALVVAIVVAIVIRCIWKPRANTIKQEEMDDGKMMTHLITEYLNEDENKKKLQPNKKEIYTYLKQKMEAEQEDRKKKMEAEQEDRKTNMEAEQEDRKEEESIMKCVPDQMIIEYSIEKYMKEEESIMKCVPDQMIIEYSIEKYMKTDERMTKWLNNTTTIEKLVSGHLDKEKNDGPTFLDKEKNDGPTSLDKEDMMKKFRSGDTTALYPLIEKYWDRDETIKWLSDEKTIKRSIAECLEKLEEERVQEQKLKEKCKNGENASGKQP